MVRVRDLVFRPFQEDITRPTLVFEIIPNPTPPPPLQLPFWGVPLKGG